MDELEMIMREAKLTNGRCMLCERRCRIVEGSSGFCRVRVRKGGKVYTLTYGALSACEVRPIEIKPFFHYWPGSLALTISTWSCNFTCDWCQNWHLSKFLVPKNTKIWKPEEVLHEALRAGCQGICVSFNEPTLLFEFCLDLFPLAKDHGLYCCFVSNGYMTKLALKELIEAGLDGLKIDLKGHRKIYRHLGLKAHVPLRNARIALKNGVHVEIVNLMVTGLSDSNKSVRWVTGKVREISKDLPLHFTRYFPAYKYFEPPTPLERLEWAYGYARKKLNYVYVGNVHGHRGLNTYCPSCGILLIERSNYRLKEVHLKDSHCPNCGFRILLRGRVC